jgi:hypothetical protein
VALVERDHDAADSLIKSVPLFAAVPHGKISDLLNQSLFLPARPCPAKGARERRGEVPGVLGLPSPSASISKAGSLPDGSNGSKPLTTGFKASTGCLSSRKRRIRPVATKVLPTPVPVPVMKTAGT